MAEGAESEGPGPEPGPERGSAAPGAAEWPAQEGLASPELAALYVQQGEYERGIAMYRALVSADPENDDLQERLRDAETLADLLILREPRAKYQAGFQEGYQRGLARSGMLSGEERIARLNAWLERVKEPR